MAKLWYEYRAWGSGKYRVCGVDEVGRGPIAGPVVAASVIFRPGHTINGVKDSKQLSSRRRCELAEEIKERSLAWAIGVGSLQRIARDNILQASYFAMMRAVYRLSLVPDLVLVDGREMPGLGLEQIGICKGDDNSDTIASASIIAKVWRDQLMDKLDCKFPQYGFGTNRGYATKEHIEALNEYGPSPIHRKTFNPVTTFYANAT